MTIKGEFLAIFEQWENGLDHEIVYITMLKWFNKYKNIVKDQDSINDLLWRITMDDGTLIIKDFIYGMCYESLRDEINNMK